MRNPDIRTRAGATLAVFMILAGTCFPLRAQTAAAAASLDQILKEISTYDGGIDSAPFWKLRDYVYARKDTPVERRECETKLLEFLATEATPVAKMAACRLLRVIGTDASVPVLQSMLRDKDAADMALYALVKIPGTGVDKALLQTLPRVEGAVKTAVIAALGERRSPEAVPVLVPLLKPGNEFAAASALALGEIGGEPAANALVAVLAAAPADLKTVVAASVTKCAEGFATAKNERAALPLYNRLLGESALPESIRKAAMIGKISTSGDQAAAVLMNQLQGADAGMQEVAILKIKDILKPDAIGGVAALLAGLPEASQVKLLAVLSGYPQDRVLPAVLQATKSSSAPVKIAALKALESVGDASTVSFLAETAAKARGPEQSAARGALNLLKGRPVDEAVLTLLTAKPSEEVQVELLLAIAERRDFTAKSVVGALLDSSSSRMRIQALKTMRTIGTPSDMPAILAFLIKTGEEAERAEAVTTVAALAQKIANPDGRANSVKGMLASEKDAKARAQLCGVLGRIGDDSALPALRTAAKDQNEEVVDAAVRALASWPTPAASDDLTLLARESKNETHRLLALQGLLRMIGLERNRRPEAVVADLKQASQLVSRPEEKRLILGALTRFACADALALAEGFLGDASVKAEAQAAAGKIKAQLAKK
jgi:HEAT repeat protein